MRYEKRARRRFNALIQFTIALANFCGIAFSYSWLQLFMQFRCKAVIQSMDGQKMPNGINRRRLSNQAPALNQDKKHTKKASDGTMSFMVWSIAGTALVACGGGGGGSSSGGGGSSSGIGGGPSSDLSGALVPNNVMIPVMEGGEVVLTEEMFPHIGEDIRYAILVGPTTANPDLTPPVRTPKGTIERQDADGNWQEISSPFTLEDVRAGNIRFNHNGDEQFAIVDGYRGTDAEATSIGFVFSGDEIALDAVTADLIVEAVNDAPVRANAGNLFLAEGGREIITTALLRFNDVDNTAAELTYTITDAPDHGTLQKLVGGAWEDIGADTFTQTDIDEGRVRYQHNGREEESDSFTYSVRDGAEGDPNTNIVMRSFGITISQGNDAPTATETTSPAPDKAVTESGHDDAGALVFNAATDAQGSGAFTHGDDDVGQGDFTGGTPEAVAVNGSTSMDSDYEAGTGGAGTAIIGEYGTLYLLDLGTWRYELNNAVGSDADALDEGETVMDRFSIRIRDDAAPDDATRFSEILPIVITITGTNDRPTITDINGGTFIDESNFDHTRPEGSAVQTFTGTAVAHDVDADDGDGPNGANDFTWSIIDSPTTTLGRLEFDNGGVGGGWTFTTDAAAFNALTHGQQEMLTYSVQVSDPQDALSAAQDLVIILEGVDDAATNLRLDGAGDLETQRAGGAAPADTMANGLLQFDDVDGDVFGGNDVFIRGGAGQSPNEEDFRDGDDAALDDDGNQGTPIEGTYGDLFLKNDGTWTYVLDENDEQTLLLENGDFEVDTFSLHIQNRISGSNVDSQPYRLDITVRGNEVIALTAPTDDEKRVFYDTPASSRATAMTGAVEARGTTSYAVVLSEDDAFVDGQTMISDDLADIVIEADGSWTYTLTSLSALNAAAMEAGLGNTLDSGEVLMRTFYIKAMNDEVQEANRAAMLEVDVIISGMDVRLGVGLFDEMPGRDEIFIGGDAGIDTFSPGDGRNLILGNGGSDRFFLESGGEDIIYHRMESDQGGWVNIDGLDFVTGFKRNEDKFILIDIDDTPISEDDFLAPDTPVQLIADLTGNSLSGFSIEFAGSSPIFFIYDEPITITSDNEADFFGVGRSGITEITDIGLTGFEVTDRSLWGHFFGDDEDDFQIVDTLPPLINDIFGSTSPELSMLSDVTFRDDDATSSTNTPMLPPVAERTITATDPNGNGLTWRWFPTDTEYGTFNLEEISENEWFWSFDFNAEAINRLDHNAEPVVLNFFINVTDFLGGRDVRSLAITLIGTNDAPEEMGSSSLSLAESGMETITTALLRFNDVDNTTAELTYTITNAPEHGTLLFEGSTLGDRTFTQANIDEGHVQYRHDDREEERDSFTYSVRDGAEEDSSTNTVTGSFSINILADNDDPMPVVSSSLSLAEGGREIITTALLRFNDVDNTAAELTYTITDAPDHGTLQKLVEGTWEDLGTNTFTQADIDEGRVRYQHNGGEDTRDSFTYSVNDGEATVPGSFSITIASVNDAPVEVNAGSLSGVNEGGMERITTALLQFTDADNRLDELTYTIVDAPEHGMLLLGGSALGDRTFTQADIDAGRVQYRHGDSEIYTDSFTYSVSDGEVTIPATETTRFVISIDAVNDAPMRVVSSGLSDVNEGEAEGITTAQLQFTDVDSAPGELRYIITNAPDHGTLLLSGIALGSRTFTQDDINNGRVEYLHDGDEEFIDSFTYSVGDGANTVSDSFAITITPVNDAPVETGLGSFSVAEGDARSLVGLLGFTDADDINTDLIYTIISGPQHGRFQEFVGPPNFWEDLNSDTFTQADIDGGRVRYQHNGSQEPSDRFTYSVRDGAVDDPNTRTVMGTFSITITNTNDAPAIVTTDGQTFTDANTDDHITRPEGSAAQVFTGTAVARDVDANDGDGPNGANDFTWSIFASPATTIGELAFDNEGVGGGWTFTTTDAAAFNRLAHEQQAAFTYRVRVSDPQDAFSPSANLVIILEGVNDVPELLVNVDNAAVTEDNSANTVRGRFTITDPDVGQDTFAFAGNTVEGRSVNEGSGFVDGSSSTQIEGQYGDLYLRNDSTWMYVLDDTDADTKALRGALTDGTEAEVVQDVFEVQLENVDDTNTQTSAVETITIQVTGANDDPVIRDSRLADLQISAFPDGGTVIRTFLSDDDDMGDTATWSFSPKAGNTEATYGAFSVDSNGVGTFTFGDGMDGNVDGRVAFDGLPASGPGNMITLEYKVKVTDGSGGFDEVDFDIVLQGQNSVPMRMVSGGFSLDEGATMAITTAQLQYTDDGGTAELTYTIMIAPEHGTLLLGGNDLSSGGMFRQDDIDNGRVQYRHDGDEELIDSFTYSVGDGVNTVSGSFNIAIVAVNDAPTITETTSPEPDKTVTESGHDVAGVAIFDAAMDAHGSGAFTHSDPDSSGGTPEVALAGSTDYMRIMDGSATISSMYGTLALTDGTWSYALNNAAGSATDALDEDDEVTDSFKIRIRDDGDAVSDDLDINIVITGTNDRPDITNVNIDNSMQSITDDNPNSIAGFFPLTGDARATDPDAEDGDETTDFTWQGTLRDPHGTLAQYGTFSFALNNSGTWTFTPDTTAINALSQDEQRVLIYDITATDSQGAVSEAEELTITLTGINDLARLVRIRADEDIVVRVRNGLDRGQEGYDPGDPFASGSLLLEDVDSDVAEFREYALTMANGFGAAAEPVDLAASESTGGITAVEGNFGTLYLNNNDFTWIYRLDNSRVTQIAVGETFFLRAQDTRPAEGGVTTFRIQLGIAIRPAITSRDQLNSLTMLTDSDLVAQYDTAASGRVEVMRGADTPSFYAVTEDIAYVATLQERSEFGIDQPLDDNGIGRIEIEDDGSWTYTLTSLSALNAAAMEANLGNTLDSGEILTRVFYIHARQASNDNRLATLRVEVEINGMDVKQSEGIPLNGIAGRNEIFVGSMAVDTFHTGDGSDIVIGLGEADVINLGVGQDAIYHRVASTGSQILNTDGADTISGFNRDDDTFILVDVDDNSIAKADFIMDTQVLLYATIQTDQLTGFELRFMDDISRIRFEYETNIDISGSNADPFFGDGGIDRSATTIEISDHNLWGHFFGDDEDGLQVIDELPPIIADLI